MKFSSLAVQEAPELTAQQKIAFPAGVIGFPDFKEAEILYKEDELPFMRLTGGGKDRLSFVIVDPANVLRDYEVEISDADTEELDIKSPEDATIFVIAALHRGKTSRITVNLVGPIVVNRKTLVARQVILANSHKYSAQHLLFEGR
jgi:flagellar assembly factor FliW